MKSSSLEDSRRCMTCHQLGQDALLAHNVATEKLQSSNPAGAASATAPVPWVVAFSDAVVEPRHLKRGILPCITCHQEHRGRKASQTELSNARCNICHRAQFADFSRGHPDFGNYPFTRRTAIVFDHGRHFRTHFKDESVKGNVPEGCSSCHEPDVLGRTMTLRSFDDTCAACHASQIEGAGRATAKGIAIVNVPGLDIESLAELEVSIGGWPVDAEDEITPVMDFLLSVDAEYVKARKVLNDVDLLDLADATAEEIDAVKIVAWRVKELLFELSVEGLPVLKKRLETAMRRSIDMAGLASLTGSLPVDAIRAARRIWFPDLITEVSAYRQRETTPVPDPDAELPDEAGEEFENIEPASGEDWSAAGGWYRDEFTLNYRPTGHADGLISAWLDVAGFPALTSRPLAAKAVFDSMSDPKAPGRCIKCHSVDVVGTGQAKNHVVNWLSKRPARHRQNFTAYSHTAHFSMLDERACDTCHALNPNAEVLASYTDHDPMTFTSNFRSIRRETCAACHNPEVAGGECLTCHNYHIGEFPPAMASVPSLPHAN